MSEKACHILWGSGGVAPQHLCASKRFQSSGKHFKAFYTLVLFFERKLSQTWFLRELQYNYKRLRFSRRTKFQTKWDYISRLSKFQRHSKAYFKVPRVRFGYIEAAKSHSRCISTNFSSSKIATSTNNGGQEGTEGMDTKFFLCGERAGKAKVQQSPTINEERMVNKSR